MTYQRFEDLPVWKAAIQLGVRVYALTENEAFRGQGSLRDQIQRAAVSVSNNIAEGFERGTMNELLSFIYIARGSAGEVRSMLCLLEHLPNFTNLKSQISNVKLLAENIARQLRGWADSLQNSDIKGQRHLNDKVRKETQRKQEHEEVLAEQRQFREELIARETARIQAAQPALAIQE
jgi:four helix bundle protein